jgi:hypothetical protein
MALDFQEHYAGHVSEIQFKPGQVLEGKQKIVT